MRECVCIGAYKWLLRLHLIWFISRLVFYTQNNKRCWKSCELCKLKNHSLSLVVHVCMCVCLCVKSSALHNTISSKIKNWQQKQQQQQLQNVVKPLGFCWFYNSNFLLLLWLSILMLHCVCVPGEKFMENERTNWKRLFCFWNFRNYTSFSFRLV